MVRSGDGVEGRLANGDADHRRLPLSGTNSKEALPERSGDQTLLSNVAGWHVP